jgi:hypothetical protein
MTLPKKPSLLGKVEKSAIQQFAQVLNPWVGLVCLGITVGPPILGALMHKPLSEIALYFLASVGLVCLVAFMWSTWKQKRRILFVLPIVAMALIFGAWLYFRISVPPAFDSAYSDYKLILGKPVKDTVLVRDPDQEQFTQALSLWVNDVGYVLWATPDQKLVVLPDPSLRSAQTPHEWDADYWRGELGLPPDCYPPTSALGAAEKNYPWLGKVGCRSWQCAYNGNSINVQEFENGLIVGLFRISISNQDNRGWIYVLLTKTNTWKKEEVKQAPDLTNGNYCKTP